jgi:hypothetical protein
MPTPAIATTFALVGPSEATTTANQIVNAINTVGAIEGTPGSFNTVPLSVNGAIGPNASAAYVITKAGVLADTLAAPTVTTSDGVTIVVTSNTANAHTITATGLFQTGTATVNLATFAAFAGASITLMAYQGKWNVISLNAVVLS